jgi:DNA-binding transcriptional LysR family regulator
MASLDDYAAFVAIVEQGNLTAAARHLGRSLQAVSRSLMVLERDLGVVLVRRTTRRSVPTVAGLSFLARLRPALGEIELACAEVSEQAGRLSGTIRIGAPILFGSSALIAPLATFAAHHPGIAFDLVLEDAYADLLAGRLDIAVRFGPLPASSMTAKRLGTMRQIVFGAPSYFATRGWPRTPTDLAEHHCIVRSSAKDSDVWTFRRDGRAQWIAIAGMFRCSGPAACNEAAVQGMGLAIAPVWQVRPHLDAGRLIPVLLDYAIDGMAIHIVWPECQLPLRTRLLIDHLATQLDIGPLQGASIEADPEAGSSRRP